MDSENKNDEIPEPIEVPDREPPRAVRGLLILVAVSILAGGVLLQNQMFKKRDRGRGVKSFPHETLTPPPAEVFPWLDNYDPANSIVARIPSPNGLSRVGSKPYSFGHWLRYLPLKPGRPEVMLYDGKPKHNQNAHFAVIDIDTGQRDLQQCADAVIRLRAEYLKSAGREEDIHFNFTSGDDCQWEDWVVGRRPVVNGDKVTWKTVKENVGDRSYANFKKYLDTVFAYAGTQSLAKELVPVKDFWDIQIGDVFIHPGRPGHAVIVVDVAEYPKTGRRGFMLAQSFMPAQDMQILVNPADPDAAPWYPVPPRKAENPNLRTPEWTFNFGELMRFNAKAE